LGDRDLTLYVRYGQRVAIEDGKVVADYVSTPPTGNGQYSVTGSVFPTPRVRTYFIAVENCNPEATNYALRFSSHIPDLPPPRITSVFLDKKDLHVRGTFLEPSSIVLFDGEPQKTKYRGQLPGNPFVEDLLVVKGARSRLRRGQSVTISVKLSGCIVYPVQYTRP
jgi:hypothetical protein